MALSTISSLVHSEYTMPADATLQFINLNNQKVQNVGRYKCMKVYNRKMCTARRWMVTTVCYSVGYD